ncbi:hypothetical protein OH76DRAFT_1486723 [Lentinus brumalis]|uniref:Uncharacterized protein n=1 Tax=Lentinus brumalis TaxID=2498619 RepID=A0A371CXJ4_9APHY|nr:hypothetical protein OH76DRAFT_1486723 [Polyporus brumalis]
MDTIPVRTPQAQTGILSPSQHAHDYNRTRLTVISGITMAVLLPSKYPASKPRSYVLSSRGLQRWVSSFGFQDRAVLIMLSFQTLVSVLADITVALRSPLECARRVLHSRPEIWPLPSSRPRLPYIVPSSLCEPSFSTDFKQKLRSSTASWWWDEATRFVCSTISAMRRHAGCSQVDESTRACIAVGTASAQSQAKAQHNMAGSGRTRDGTRDTRELPTHVELAPSTDVLKASLSHRRKPTMHCVVDDLQLQVLLDRPPGSAYRPRRAALSTRPASFQLGALPTATNTSDTHKLPADDIQSY